jgi:hypothetical protein
MEGGSATDTGRDIAACMGTDPSNEGTDPSNAVGIDVGTAPPEISFAEGGAIVLSSRISKNIGSIEIPSASVDETCGNPYIMPAAKPA